MCCLKASYLFVFSDAAYYYLNYYFFNFPWYSVPKVEEIKQSKLIKAAGTTNCSVHRHRKNSHAVGSRCIAAELWKAAEKEKEKSHLLSRQRHNTPLIFRPKSAKISPVDELISPSVSNACTPQGGCSIWWFSSGLPTPTYYYCFNYYYFFALGSKDPEGYPF